MSRHSKSPPPDPRIEVRLINSRGAELAAALETDILPIKSYKDKASPKREFVSSEAGKFWCFIADASRLTERQLDNLSVTLAAKYKHDNRGDPDMMKTLIKAQGFTVPVDDCIILTRVVTEQPSFLDRSQPKDYEP